MIGLGFIRDVLGVEFLVPRLVLCRRPGGRRAVSVSVALSRRRCAARAEAKSPAAGNCFLPNAKSSDAGPLAQCFGPRRLRPHRHAVARPRSSCGDGRRYSPVYKWFDDCVPEPIAALLGAALLFFLPGDGGRRAIDWPEAAKIDWGIILIFGGGLSLGVLASQTGLAQRRRPRPGSRHSDAQHVGPCPLATITAALVSEVTSNTASATMVVPVVIGVAQAAGVDPLEPALAATLGSGLGFMLPVSTPCNAIVYSSGRIPLRTMMAYGLMLDIVGVLVIVASIRLIVPLVR